MLYTDNFHKVERYIHQNSGTSEQAKDVYQDAFVAVWQQVKNGNFIPANETAINGYLFQIAKNKWVDYLRSSAYKKTSVLSDNLMVADEEDDFLDRVHQEDNRVKETYAMFKVLGESCKNVLTQFYFYKKSLREIAEELDLDEASARNKKYRCMQKLREMLLKKNKSQL